MVIFQGTHPLKPSESAQSYDSVKYFGDGSLLTLANPRLNSRSFTAKRDAGAHPSVTVRSSV